MPKNQRPYSCQWRRCCRRRNNRNGAERDFAPPSARCGTTVDVLPTCKSYFTSFRRKQLFLQPRDMRPLLAIPRPSWAQYTIDAGRANVACPAKFMFDYPVYLYTGREQICSSCCRCPSYSRWANLGHCWVLLPQYRKLVAKCAHRFRRTPKQMRRIVRRHFRWLGANLLYGVKFTACRWKNLGRMRLENFELVENWLGKEAVCLAHQSHRFLGVYPIISFLARTADRDHLSTHPQSAH